MHARTHRDGEADDQRLRLREVGGGKVGLNQPVGAGGCEERGCVEVGGEGQLDSVGIHGCEHEREVADECVGARGVLVKGREGRACRTPNPLQTPRSLLMFGGVTLNMEA